MTLSEMLVVLAIMGIILAALAGVLSMSITQSSQIQEQSILQTEVRDAVDTMARELRQAYTGDSTYPIETATSTTLQFLSPDKAVPFHNRRIAYRLAGGQIDRAMTTSTDTDGAPWTGLRLDGVRLHPVRLVVEAGRLRRRTARSSPTTTRPATLLTGHDHAVVRVPGPDHRHGGDQGRLHAAVHLLHERQPEVGARMTRDPRSRRRARGRHRHGARRHHQRLHDAARRDPDRRRPRRVRPRRPRELEQHRRSRRPRPVSTTTSPSSSTTMATTCTTCIRPSRRGRRRRGVTVAAQRLRVRRDSARHRRGRVDVRHDLDVPERQGQLVPAAERLLLQPAGLPARHRRQPHDVGADRRRPARRSRPRRRTCGPIETYVRPSNLDRLLPLLGRRRRASTPRRTGRSTRTATSPTRARRTPTSSRRAPSTAARRMVDGAQAVRERHLPDEQDQEPPDRLLQVPRLARRHQARGAGRAAST